MNDFFCLAEYNVLACVFVDCDRINLDILIYYYYYLLLSLKQFFMITFYSFCIGGIVRLSRGYGWGYRARRE